MFQENRRQWISKQGGTTLALAATWGLGLSGCTFSADEDHDGADAPTPAEKTLSLPSGSNRLVLVLGSGGPRGFVHAGILRALDEIGVRPAAVVGSSVGSLVGAIYAAGYTGKEIETLAIEARTTDLGAIALGSKERFSGKPIAQWVNRLVADRLGSQVKTAFGSPEIQRLPTPFVAAGLRQGTQEVIGFAKGNLGVAVQASCAIEGTFIPVKIRGQIFLDADRVAPVPVRLARSLFGPQIRTLSVDASAHEDKAPEGAQRFRQSDLFKRAITLPDTQTSDLNLHPFFGYWVSITEEFRRRAIEAGYRETMAQASRIIALAKA